MSARRFELARTQLQALPAGDRAAVAVADDELARGVALVQQVQHNFAPAILAKDAYRKRLLDPEGLVDLAALASCPSLSAWQPVCCMLGH